MVCHEPDFAVTVGKIELFGETSSLGPFDADPFHGQSHQGAAAKQTYIHPLELDQPTPTPQLHYQILSKKVHTSDYLNPYCKKESHHLNNKSM